MNPYGYAEEYVKERAFWPLEIFQKCNFSRLLEIVRLDVTAQL